MSSVCRVCLAGNTRLHSLKNILLIEVFEKLSDIKFNSEDARPRAVCYSCNQKLLRCHALAQMVHRSEKIFSNLFNQGLETTQENITDVKQGMKQQFSVTAKQLIAIDDNTTDECSKVTIKDEPVPGVHIKEELITEQDKLVEVESLAETITKSVIPLEENNKDHGNDVEDLPSRSHVEQTKPDDPENSLINLLTCKECDKRFRYNCDLVRHMKLHTGIKPFACNECDKRFFEKSGLVRHIKIHTGEKSFACYACNKQFYEKSGLVRHMTIHTGNKPFACTVCVKKFNAKSSLVGHMRIHTGEKPFGCNVCDKEYIHKNSLVIHMRTHSEGKTFACKICDKDFFLKFNLFSHMKTHTREKPFICNVCDKRFSRKEHLVKHMRIHTGEKPFACNVCDKQFKRKHHIVKHIFSHMKTHEHVKSRLSAMYVINDLAERNI